MKFTHLSILGLATHAAAYLATTTRYYDGQEGACGCGTSSGNFAWQLGISTGVYTAAGSQALFDTAGASWCGAGCGKCYNLTSTGSSPAGSSSEGGAAGDSIIVMVTNLCPYDGNAVWCPPVGGTNEYGYSYHFDIMAQEIIFGDNVIVDFEPVACPGQATSDWDTCVCYDNVALQTDVTPADLKTGGSVPPTSSTSTSSSSTTSTKASTTSTTSTTASSSTTNTKASKTSTKSTTATSTSTGSSGGTGTQTLYGQCGGIGWPTSSPTACAAPATCTELNPYYYQCLG